MANLGKEEKKESIVYSSVTAFRVGPPKRKPTKQELADRGDFVPAHSSL